jgi:hypothetical protein
MENHHMKKTILILAANPKDTQQLRLDQEVREITNGLRGAKKKEDFVLQQVWAARPADVRKAMLDFKPNIVHFCGHGAGQAGITFEDETGKIKLVDAETLADLFALFANSVKCVVLNACYAEIQAQAIARHIDCVVGMKKEIGDIAAIEFAAAFYDALGAGETVEFAFRLACNALRWAGIPEHRTPVLIIREHAPGERQPPLVEGQAADKKPGMTTDQIQAGKLTAWRIILSDRLDLEELKTMCFDMKVDFDNLRGDGKAAKVRELILYLERHGQIENLNSEVGKARPDIKLP